MHGAIQGMSKKNRKNRLVISREPNGRETREPHSEFSPTKVRRLRDAALKGMADAEWGTELGRYYLENTITSEMYSAGRWWAELASRYSHAIEAHKMNPRALGFECGAIASPPDPDSDRGQEISRHDRRAVAEFEAARTELSACGILAERMVRNLCEHDEGPCGQFQLDATRHGLRRLAGHRDLTNRGKSVHVR